MENERVPTEPKLALLHLAAETRELIKDLTCGVTFAANRNEQGEMTNEQTYSQRIQLSVYCYTPRGLHIEIEADFCCTTRQKGQGS